MVYNMKVFEVVWDYFYDCVVYFGINILIDKCYECNFEGEFVFIEEGFKCLSCGNIDFEKVDVVKCICGYLGNLMKCLMVYGCYVEISNCVKYMENLGE